MILIYTISIIIITVFDASLIPKETEESEQAPNTTVPMTIFNLTQLIHAGVPHVDLTITSNPVDPFEKMLDDLLQSSPGEDCYMQS